MLFAPESCHGENAVSAHSGQGRQEDTSVDERIAEAHSL